ncbi:MAG TPA: Ig-like domain-containing protein [Gemmatimonadaceae bacterium]|nr:Ig-like domain-containing protein [Gemmatimonadaceae bacterium]
MARTSIQNTNKVHDAARIVARVVAVGAALGTVATSIHEFGLDGAQTRRTIGNFGATWVGLAPANDTATSIGDTVHLAATVTDKKGTALVGTNIKWTIDHPDVAIINPDGTVIAHNAGTATVIVTVGELMARATVVVRPIAAHVHIANDSSVTVAELLSRPLSVVSTDTRGHVILAARSARWRSSDTAVAKVDTAGTLTAVAEGHATITALVDGVSAEAPVIVVPVPQSLALVAGGGQDAPAGSTLAEPVIVKVLSRRGKPLGGLTVKFRRADVNSTADVAQAQTDAEGRAHCVWKLGDLAGRQRLAASTDGVDTVVTVEAEAEPVSANTRTAALADSQTSKIATALAVPVGVRITDTTGRVMGDLAVRWVALDGGSITSTVPRTDSLGEVRATWVLGPRAGPQHVRALIGDGRTVRPVVLHALATAGAPAAVGVVSGDAQHGAPSAATSKPIVLRVTDAAGNPVRGVSVNLVPKHGAGTLPDSTPVTDSLGLVRSQWTLGATIGAQHMTARVDGVPKTVELTATAAATSSKTRPRRHHAG